MDVLHGSARVLGGRSGCLISMSEVFVLLTRMKSSLKSAAIHFQYLTSQPEYLNVSGSPANVALAKEAIQDKMLEVDADNEDRKQKSFEVKLTVSQDYFPKIIGKKCAVVNKIREDHQVQIILPARQGGGGVEQGGGT